ncbi:MAG: ROK family transcriptional regulator [Thermotogota bacterium]
MNLFSDPLGMKPTILKKINMSSIIRILMKYQPISRTEIAKKSGISKPTVSKLVNLLMDDDYLFDAGKKESVQGKRQSLLTLNPEKAKTIVVDIGLRKTTLSVVNFAFEILMMKTFNTIKDLQSFIKQLTSEIDQLMKETKTNPEKIVISVPGTVDSNLRKVYDVPLLGWKNVLFSDLIELELDKHDIHAEVLIENDANLGMVSEVMLNKAIETRNKNIIFILIKEGIGLGFYINNGFYFGRSHSAGEFGHMTIDKSAKGKKKWLDLAGSEEMENYVAKGRIEEYVEILAIGFINVINGLDPDICVFSGECCRYWDDIYPCLREKTNNLSKVENPEQLEITCSAFKNIESSLLGGGIIGFKDYIEMSSLID